MTSSSRSIFVWSLVSNIHNIPTVNEHKIYMEIWFTLLCIERNPYISTSFDNIDKRGSSPNTFNAFNWDSWCVINGILFFNWLITLIKKNLLKRTWCDAALLVNQKDLKVAENHICGTSEQLNSIFYTCNFKHVFVRSIPRKKNYSNIHYTYTNLLQFVLVVNQVACNPLLRYLFKRI